MNKKKKNKIFLLLILLLGITVGFAALATTLKINGNAGIGKNSWNIYWDSIGNEDGVTPETATEIVDEDTTHKKNIVTFDVKFDKPGDFYEFQVDAVNAGTIDAEILEIESKYNDTVIPSSGTSPLPSYLKYSVKYADGTDITVGDKLAKRTSTTEFTRRRYKIRVEYDKDAVTIADVNNQVGDVTHSFSFKVVYGQSIPTPSPAVAFATDSWDIIAEEGNQAATQTAVTNNKCGAYNVGDTKEVDLGSEYGVVTVRIANCSTPAVCSTPGYSQTACGFVVEFEDIITSRGISYQDLDDTTTIGLNNNGGWEYSDMRAFLNGTTYAYKDIDYSTDGIFSSLPSDLKDALDDTTVVSGHGSEDMNNFTTTDKLYLLSSKEVWGGGDSISYDTAASDTRQLDYYYGLGVTSTNYSGAIKLKDDHYNTYWWLRTSFSDDYWRFYNVNNYGEWMLNPPEEFIGVSPAFKLK